MKHLFIVTLLVLAAFATPLAAPQAKPTATPAVQADQPPSLDENTALKLENVYLKLANLQRAQEALITDLQKVIADIETKHPGWTWDAQAQRLVKKEAPKK